MNLDAALHTWANAATVLVIAGAAFYVTLIPYMTRDK
jgi:hypothetical protein